ncbi:hypothetical protein Tco_1372702 [Tanacetum coccineum]
MISNYLSNLCIVKFLPIYSNSLIIHEGPCRAESSHLKTSCQENKFSNYIKFCVRRRHLIPNPKPRSRDTSLVTLGQSAINLAHQKSYADVRQKPIKFQVDNLVMLKVLEQVESVAYKLKLPQELSRVHNTFHVSNLKKCYSDDPLVVPLEGLQVDNKLHFVEEPVEIMDREVKQLRRSRVPIVKVRWNSRRGPEFTWEREDQFRKKYPHLFTKTAPSSSAVS